MPFNASAITRAGANIGNMYQNAFQNVGQSVAKGIDQGKEKKKAFDRYRKIAEGLGMDSNEAQTMSLGELQGWTESQLTQREMQKQELLNQRLGQQVAQGRYGLDQAADNAAARERYGQFIEGASQYQDGVGTGVLSQQAQERYQRMLDYPHVAQSVDAYEATGRVMSPQMQARYLGEPEERAMPLPERFQKHYLDGIGNVVVDRQTGERVSQSDIAELQRRGSFDTLESGIELMRDKNVTGNIQRAPGGGYDIAHVQTVRDKGYEAKTSVGQHLQDAQYYLEQGDDWAVGKVLERLNQGGGKKQYYKMKRPVPDSFGETESYIVSVYEDPKTGRTIVEPASEFNAGENAESERQSEKENGGSVNNSATNKGSQLEKEKEFKRSYNGYNIRAF